jgi:hypothetical protein
MAGKSVASLVSLPAKLDEILHKDWISLKHANLYHGDKLVGVITNITVEDMFFWSGDIELTDAAGGCQVMFDYFNDEERQREPEEPDEEPLPIVGPEGEVFWRD